MTDEPTGRWYSYGPGGLDDDLPEGLREEILRRRAETEERRGHLLARVVIQIWENGEAVPSVNVRPEGPLSVEDTAGIAEAVRIARDALDGWR